LSRVFGPDCQAARSLKNRAVAGIPPSVGLRPPCAETPATILILIDARSDPDRRAAGHNQSSGLAEVLHKGCIALDETCRVGAA